jgi:hypothetical protein
MNTILSVIAAMPAFAGRPLPIRPRARCSQATARGMPQRPAPDNGIPFYVAPIGTIEVYYDESIPDGTIEIDGVSITVDELQAAVTAAEGDHA